MNTSYIKITFLACFWLLFQTNTKAQNFYFSLQGGTAVGINNTNLGYDYVVTSDYDKEISIETVTANRFSFGQGTNIGANVGYRFSNHFGLELGFSILQSKAFTNLYSERDFSEMSNYESIYSDSETLSAKMTQFQPSIVYHFGEGKWIPYAKLGAIIGAGNINSEYSNSSIDRYGMDVETSSGSDEYEFKNGLAIGYNATLGVEFDASKSIKIFGEARLNSLSYAPTKGFWVKSTEDGVNYPLENEEVYYKEVDFVDSYSADYMAETNYSEPDKSLKQSYSFSNIGFELGIRFVL